MTDLVRAGPIVRRVEAQGVAVWVALRERRVVRLRVYSSQAWDGDTSTPRPGTILKGERETLAVGEHLHIAVVWATDGSGAAPGDKCFYDVEMAPVNAPPDETTNNLGSEGLLDARGSPGKLPGAALGYIPKFLPSFVVPPADISKLGIIHGSCRKPHAPGWDALVTVDDLIDPTTVKTEDRPHQLLLTGDQIYADDVAAGLLGHLTMTGTSLLGWPNPEFLPGIDQVVTDPAIGPLKRQPLIFDRGRRGPAGFTSDHARCHLMSLGEYCAMYLAVWSEDGFPYSPPEPFTFFPDATKADFATPAALKAYAEAHGLKPAAVRKTLASLMDEQQNLASFASTLPRVRRALANIACYMMFDDHEVTDDWYLDGDATTAMLEAPLGTRIITNALAAYTVFQGWGNDPVYFQSGKGAELLQEIEAWRGGVANSATIARISELVGAVPQSQSRSDRVVFDYAAAWPTHRLLVLDTRTWRSSIGAAPSELLGEGALREQLVQKLPPTPDRLTVVVSPAPALGFTLVEGVQDILTEFIKQYAADNESWRRNRVAFERLLAALAKAAPVVILSGDVHYAFSVGCQYWALDGAPGSSVMQLVSSALKNQSAELPTTTLGLQKFGARIAAMTGNIQSAVAGWSNPSGGLRLWGRDQEGREYSYKPGTFVVEDTNDVSRCNRQSDWAYLVSLLRERRAAPPPLKGDLPEIDAPPTGASGEEVLKAYRAIAMRKGIFLDTKGRGTILVGLNNIGELRFETTPTAGVHRLYWWPPDVDKIRAALPLTEHRFRLDGPTESRPHVPVTP